MNTPQLLSNQQEIRGKQFGNVDGFCNFGLGDDSTWCSWNSPGHVALSRAFPHPVVAWTLSNGRNALWVGGPRNDTSGDIAGGYAFHETSSAPGRLAQMAVMESNAQPATGARGKCLKFWYALDGLSADMLKVKVKAEGDRNKMVTIWETRDVTRGNWKEAQALYTFTRNHTIVIEALPARSDDPFNIFRGHVAVDDLGVRDGRECVGLCSFEGGMCDWSNALFEDDFDWILGRGTQNPITGPPRDRSSSQESSLGGAYIYIDSAFPRRPDDAARLESIEFQETDPSNPPCMRFYTFMSGRGVGALRVLLQDVTTRQERVLWALAGSQGSDWVMAQLPLSSSTPFKVVFEGRIGKPRLGDIAIDDITILSGPCATLPTAASPPSSGDCTFEDGLCGWNNPSLRNRLDDLDFLRTRASDLAFPSSDHTFGGAFGHFMSLESPEAKLEGDRSWLISPIMPATTQTKCISFWYMMFEPLSDNLEPNLGSLSAFLKRDDPAGSIVLTPIWTLHNFQGLTWYFGQAPLRVNSEFQVVFEGVWGSADSQGTIAIDDISMFEGNCPTIPDAAVVRAGDCTFTRGSCGWRNFTSDPDFYWTNASPLRRPVSMNDHTYGAHVGYIYFDVFNLNSRSQRLQLVSPVMEPSEDRSPLCFTFSFAGFGADINTTLRVYQRPAQDEDNALITNLTDDILQIWRQMPLQENLSGWQFGQVALVAATRFQIVIEGTSYNGGFTLDDFKIYNGACTKRPVDIVKTRT